MLYLGLGYMAHILDALSKYWTSNWPVYDGMDIMEAINKENKVYVTCHWQSKEGHAQNGKESRSFDIT